MAQAKHVKEDRCPVCSTRFAERDEYPEDEFEDGLTIPVSVGDEAWCIHDNPDTGTLLIYYHATPMD